MASAKLTILVEAKNGNLDFANGQPIEVKFNPSRLVYNKSASWTQHGPAKRDNPELQFTGAEPGTLKVDLLFDTYDTPSASKESVRKLTNRLLHLTTVEQHGDKHRPPVCRLIWGRASMFFQGVLQSLEQQFTLFMEDGTPVRATVSCTFKEWRANYEDLRAQYLRSPDVAKLRVFKRGDSLASIAAEEYLDARKWRPIAQANDIDDPLAIVPGTELVIPSLRTD